jgi:cell division septum initiation protein DivIVA
MIAQLLQEIRELRERVEVLEEKVLPKGQQKKKGVPDNVKIYPPWEREGISKHGYIAKKKAVKEAKE